MSLAEKVDRLENAGLDQSVGITHLPEGSALIARNVQIYPTESIAKRPGYRRFADLHLSAFISCVCNVGDNVLTVGGDIDAS